MLRNSKFTFGENSSFQNESLLRSSLNGNNYSNYINMPTEEIIKAINEKKGKIMEYHNINKILKKELINILEKVNLLTLKNKDKLLLNNDSENDLHTLINNKKKEYFIIKNYNSQLKKEYSLLLKKTKNIPENNITEFLSNYKTNIENLKNENKEIKKEITKNETKQMEQQNRVKKIRYDNIKIKNISNYNEKLNKYLEIKSNFINSINNSSAIIKGNKQELDKLEKLIKSKNKLISKNEKLSNKIQNEMDIIKKDLSGTIEEIVEKCINDNILIYSIINKNNNDMINKSMNKKEISSEIEEANRNINNNSNISSNVVLVNSPSDNIFNHTKASNTKKKNKIKLNPIIYRNNSQSFITDKIRLNLDYNSSNFNNNLKQINDLLSSDNNINNNKVKNRYNNINNLDNKGSFSNEDIKRIKEKLKFRGYHTLSMDLSCINYNLADEEMYRKLKDKKKYFLDESERIDFNIKEIKKTFLTKNIKVTNTLKSNINKLNDIKIINMKIQEEINKLRDLMKEIEGKSIKNNENKK